VCLAGSRLFVQRGIYGEFCERYVAAAEALVVGDPRDAATQLGPLVSTEHLDKVMSYIQLGHREGAKLLTGGERVTTSVLGAGNYVAPTVFADVDNSWRIAREEIFGPVQVIAPFDDVDEAIALANDSRYGLAGQIWTSNLDAAHKVARGVRTGTMWVNCFYIRDLRAPFGGMKDSGVGREGGLHSEEFFTEAKTVVIQFPS
jgi:aminomuconate-semialdehyde/2-hydroxymuconate-6-semialdehyde dehydrogenase